MPTFQSLVDQIKTVKCQETRAIGPDYCEVVVAKDHLPAAITALEAYFSAPLKPAGKKSSKEADAIAKPYGGVHENQTLYYIKTQTESALALLWPWGGGMPVTIKIIKGKS